MFRIKLAWKQIIEEQESVTGTANRQGECPEETDIGDPDLIRLTYIGYIYIFFPGKGRSRAAGWHPVPIPVIPSEGDSIKSSVILQQYPVLIVIYAIRPAFVNHFIGTFVNSLVYSAILIIIYAVGISLAQVLWAHIIQQNACFGDQIASVRIRGSSVYHALRNHGRTRFGHVWIASCGNDM